MKIIKFCRWLDSNCWPLMSEGTALPTEQQPLPHNYSSCKSTKWFFMNRNWCKLYLLHQHHHHSMNKNSCIRARAILHLDEFVFVTIRIWFNLPSGQRVKGSTTNDRKANVWKTKVLPTSISPLGGSPGPVVMGWDLESAGFGFKSLISIKIGFKSYIHQPTVTHSRKLLNFTYIVLQCAHRLAQYQDNNELIKSTTKKFQVPLIEAVGISD